MNVNDKSFRGYLTVEASFVMPLVLMLIFFLMFLSFFVYDRTVLFQDGYSLAFRGSQKALQVVEMKNYLDQHAKEQFGEKYFAVEDFSHAISVTKKKVTIEMNMSVALLTGKKALFQMPNRRGITEQISVDVRNPTKTTRSLRTGERLVQNLSDLSKSELGEGEG